MSDSKWIRFVEAGTSPSGMTRRWTVIPTAQPDLALGLVSWYAPWRCYAFSPAPGLATVYERRCLRDIADFCEERTREHASRGKAHS